MWEYAGGGDEAFLQGPVDEQGKSIQPTPGETITPAPGFRPERIARESGEERTRMWPAISPTCARTFDRHAIAYHHNDPATMKDLMK